MAAPVVAPVAAPVALALVVPAGSRPRKGQRPERLPTLQQMNDEVNLVMNDLRTTRHLTGVDHIRRSCRYYLDNFHNYSTFHTPGGLHSMEKNYGRADDINSIGIKTVF